MEKAFIYRTAIYSLVEVLPVLPEMTTNKPKPIVKSRTLLLGSDGALTLPLALGLPLCSQLYSISQQCLDVQVASLRKIKIRDKKWSIRSDTKETQTIVRTRTPVLQQIQTSKSNR